MASITNNSWLVEGSLPALLSALNFLISIFASLIRDLLSFLERCLNSFIAEERLVESRFTGTSTGTERGITKAANDCNVLAVRKISVTTKNRYGFISFKF